MKKMKNELQQLLQQVLHDLDLENLGVVITPTQDPSHGDYATNVAFQAAKKLGVSPMEAGEIISKELRAKGGEQFANIEVAAPGFINFTLSSKSLLGSLQSEHKKLVSPTLDGSKIMIEFTDPNPFKEFHIGHLYSNIVGESISRILEANGAEVRRVCYQGDVGLHVAKALWGLQQKMSGEGLKVEALEAKSLDERAQFLGQSYALGATKYEESDSAKQEIIKINKMVYDKDTEIMPLYEKGRQWSLEYFETIYARLGTRFVDYYFESEAGPRGVDLVRQYKDTVFEESNGAVIFPGEKYGLHTRVFINSLGLPTYEAKELGLAVTKYEDYAFDSSIVITGNEIDEYFRVLLKALSLIQPEIAAKMKHLSHGMVRLPEGKMSSRTGNVKTGEWLLNEARDRAQAKIEETKGSEEAIGTRVSSVDEAEVSEMVGLAAVKWALLRSGIGRDVEFSFDESVSFEGNSGPYLQYTFVRTQSVLSKWRMVNGKWNPKDYSLFTINYPLAGEERVLLVLLCQYSDIVTSAAERFSPSDITTYLFELAQAFNLFYQKYPIIKEEEGIRDFRLALTDKVGQTIKDGLYLLGIQSPERM